MAKELHTLVIWIDGEWSAPDGIETSIDGQADEIVGSREMVEEVARDLWNLNDFHESRFGIESVHTGCVEVLHPEGAVAWKQTDPTEDARWIYDATEAAEIDLIDPNLLIWV